MQKQSNTGPSLTTTLSPPTGAARRGATITKRDQKLARENSMKAALWVIGIIVALLPYFWSKINANWFYADNEIARDSYLEFASEFIYGGELLWIAVTLLFTSLTEAFINGYKRDLRKVEPCKIFLFFFGCILDALGLVLYIGTIREPISTQIMPVVSVTVFIGFAFASGYLTITSLFQRRTTQK